MSTPRESMSRDEIGRLVAESAKVFAESAKVFAESTKVLIEAIQHVGLQSLVLQRALMMSGVVSLEDIARAHAAVEAQWAVESALRPGIRAQLDELQRLKDQLEHADDDDPGERDDEADAEVPGR